MIRDVKKAEEKAFGTVERFASEKIDRVNEGLFKRENLPSEGFTSLKSALVFYIQFVFSLSFFLWQLPFPTGK
ncbi:hypothetical protein [Caldibacillus debilis]|uniref:hypothetical protein n=1 Tax=Caldibacillus debilis TaxID=301148 RepID=UPI000EA85FCE|nr:hypothetical protein [Caldibacillus debilis]